MHSTPEWYENLASRWAYRQARERGAPESTGSINRELIVPADSDGRPGYRLSTAGPSAITRAYAGHGSMSEFKLRTGRKSYLIGMCRGRSADDEGLHAAATTAVEGTMTWYDGRVWCIVEPTETRLANEPAVFYTLQITNGGATGMTVTDTMFDHAGWRFTIGSMHSPHDGPEALEIAAAILASWTWLPARR